MTKKSAAAAAAMILVLASSAAASVKDVDLPPVKEYRLDNGLRVYMAVTEELPLVNFRLLVPAGSVDDGEGRQGLASITAAMLLKGAGGMSAEEISEAIEGVGGRLEASASREYTVIEGDFLSRDIDLGLGLLSRAVLSPEFPEEEFEREKGIELASLKGVKENPYALANREFLKAMAEGGPYGDPTGGYVSTVEKLDTEDLRKFHQAHFVPDGAILAVVGDIDEEALKGVIEKDLGRWSGTRPPAEEGSADRGDQSGDMRVVVIDKPGLTQSQIRIGNRAAPMRSPDHFELAVANSILGGGFTSRLMDEIRVNRGLSYGARSYLLQYGSAGYFGIYTFTKNETLRETIDVALEQAGLMRDSMVPGKELAGAKRYISGLFPFQIETNGDIAEWLTKLPFYGLGTDYVEKYRSSIEAVSAGGVEKAAEENFLPGGGVIVLVTDYSKTSSQLEGLGDIEVIPVGELED